MRGCGFSPPPAKRRGEQQKKKKKEKEKKLASLAKPAEVGVLLLRFVSVCHRFESL